MGLVLLLFQPCSEVVHATEISQAEPANSTQRIVGISEKAKESSFIEIGCGSGRPYRLKKASPTLPDGSKPVCVDERVCYFNPDYRTQQKAKYTKMTKQLCDSWLLLDEFSNESLASQLIYDMARDGIREALVRIYREHLNLQGQANFIDRAPREELRLVIRGCKSGDLASFPDWDLKYVYRVSKTNSGLFTFMPIESDHGAFTVMPDNPYYDLVAKHVGRIRVGEVKLVPRLPFRVGEEASFFNSQ